MKILALTKYPVNGPSSRYRFHQYLPALTHAGFQITIANFFSQHYLDKLFKSQSVGIRYLVGRCLRRLLVCIQSKNYDLIWIEGELLPFFPAWFERFLHLWMPKKKAYDFDDAVWLRYGNKKWLAKKYLKILADATVVMVGNEYLANYVNQVQKQTVYLPTVINGEKYAAIQAPLTGKVIGWIGSPTTLYFLQSLRPVFEALKREIDFELHVIGAELPWVDQFQGKCFAWSEATETSLIAGFDVGIMPLDDSPWAEGKCGLKLIQYLAAGVPAVASPVGVNPFLIETSGGGFLANDQNAWIESLSNLLTRPSLRREVAHRGRKWALDQWTIQAQVPTLIDAFKRAART